MLIFFISSGISKSQSYPKKSVPYQLDPHCLGFHILMKSHGHRRNQLRQLAISSGNQTWLAGFAGQPPKKRFIAGKIIYK